VQPSWFRQLTAFFREHVRAVSEDSSHDRSQWKGDSAAHPIERPATTLAALRILAMAQVMAGVRDENECTALRITPQEGITGLRR